MWTKDNVIGLKIAYYRNPENWWTFIECTKDRAKFEMCTGETGYNSLTNINRWIKDGSCIILSSPVKPEYYEVFKTISIWKN